MAVKALLTVSGTVEVNYPDATTLGSADAMVPDQLAADIRAKVLTISGVSSAMIRCGIIDVMEVTT